MQMGILNVLFIIILIVIALRLIMRYVLPFILARYVRKKQQEFYDMMNNDQKTDKKEGEINIDYIPKDQKKKDLNDLGEYTDYEDVD